MSRERAASSGNIEEYFKRKRQEIAKREQEELQIFQKRSKINRTPTKQNKEGLLRIDTKSKDQTVKTEEKDMEGLKKLMEEIKTQNNEMRQEMKDNYKEIKDEIKTNNEEMKLLRDELKLCKAEWEKDKDKWEKEKTEIRNEMEQMKKKLENQEKKEKRNKIIIRGVKFNKETIKQEAKEFFLKEIGVAAEIEEAYKVGKSEANMTVVKMEKFEQKIEILKRKSRLGQREIYIESDLTNDEQRVQAAIRKVAREEKANGKKTKVGYRKVEINNVIYEWAEKEGGSLVKRKDQASKN